MDVYLVVYILVYVFAKVVSIVDFRRTGAILLPRMNPAAYSRFGVTGVSFDKATGRSRLLLSEASGTARLAFEVEPHQAGEVILHANGYAPQNSDVLQLFLRAHGFRLMYARITAVQAGSANPAARAEIHYQQGSRLFRLELEPAQAVALSARAATPVYIDRRLIAGWQERSPEPGRQREEVLPIPAL